MEERYGVDLLNVIRRQDTDGDFAHGYFPTDTRIFIDILEDFKITDDDAVLDIGAGKGSGVVSLAAAGFQNIGAIEYTTKIYDVLSDNMRLMGMDRVSLLCGDASTLTSELDRYNYFFLFNPFDWKTMDNLLKNLRDSINRVQRKIRVIYAEPLCHNLIMSTNEYSLIRVNKNDYSNVSYYTYMYENNI